VFLIGILIFLLAGPDRKRTLRVLRPFFGVGLCCLLVLPWWFLLQHQLKTLGVDIEKTQLSGSLLTNLAGWKEILSGYYLWTLLSLMVPASLLVPFLLPRVWRTRASATGPTRMLLLASAVLLVVFTVGGHYRKHYLLPLLPISAMLLANAVHTGAYPGLKDRWKHLLLGAFAVLAALCLGLILRNRDFAALSWMLLNAIPLFYLLRQELRLPAWESDRSSAQLVMASAAVAILTTGYTAFLPMAITRWRASEQAFAKTIGATLQPSDLIVQWQSNVHLLPFYTKRPVPAFGELDKLAAYYLEHKAAHNLYVVFPRAELPRFSAVFDGKVLQTIKRQRHPEDDLVFMTLSGLKSTQPGAPTS